MSKSIINGHIGFQNIDLSVIPPKFDPTSKNEDSIKQDKIFELIFVPDSTGFPDAAASIAFEKSSDPIVREFISRKLMEHISSGTSVDTADIALELTQGFEESAEDYRQRLSDYVYKVNKKSE